MIEGKSHVIKIDDFSLEIVKHFLEMLYTGNCTAPSSLGGILLMADKYQLPHLIKLCLNHMHVNMSATTVVQYLSALNKTSHLPECQALRETIINCVQYQPEIVKAMAQAL